MHTHSEIITLVQLINISSTHRLITFFVTRAPEICSFSPFPVFHTVLLTRVLEL